MASSESSVDNRNSLVSGFAPNWVLLSPSAVQNPFLRPTKPNLATVVSSPNIMRDLHCSLLSTVDKCLRFLQTFVSQNPVFNNILSLSSDSSNFAKSCSRNYRKEKTLSNHNFAAILPGDSVAGIVVANGILNFLNIYNTLLVVRLVLTWFPNSPPAIVSPLSTLCDPYLNIFRGIIPPLGGTLDLSPILAFLVLNAFSSTAAALPAELPMTGPSEGAPSRAKFNNLTSSQEKWMRRLFGNQSKRSRNTK